MHFLGVKEIVALAKSSHNAKKSEVTNTTDNRTQNFVAHQKTRLRSGVCSCTRLWAMRILLTFLLFVRMVCLSKKVLVIGGTGRVGSAVVNRLQTLGIETAVMSRSVRSSPKAADENGVVQISGDVISMQDLLRATKDCDAVIDVHGCTPPRFSKITDLFKDPSKDVSHPYNVNYIAMIKLTTAMTINRVPKLVRITGSFVDKSPFKPFVTLFNLLLSQTVKWHEMGEICIRKSGIDYTVIRPPGIRDNLTVPEPHKLVLVPGDSVEDIQRPGQIAVRDLAALCVLAVDETRLSNATVVSNTVPGQGAVLDGTRATAEECASAEDGWRTALAARPVGANSCGATSFTLLLCINSRL